MKKKKISLERKLLLNKEIVTGLGTVQGGGATDTCPVNSNPCNCVNTLHVTCGNSCFCTDLTLCAPGETNC
ncbi:class I lanthipeptide [Taibaiella helva]|uniref:class I lanthipeptide n=1 Tax=Taibaiella helva TaxID=2301235 RepID=UPI0018E4ED72